MPLSEERKAQLLQQYGQQKPAAPVNLIMPNSEEERNAAISDVYNAGRATPSGISEERKAELLAMYGKKNQETAKEQKSSDYWRSILPREKGYEYGAIYPYRFQRDSDGKPLLITKELAWPEMVRSIPQGIADLYQEAEKAAGATTETGGYNPQMTPDALGVVANIALMNPTFSRAPKQSAPNPLIPDKFTLDQTSGGIGATQRLANTVAKNEAKLSEPVSIYEDMLSNFQKVKQVNDTNYTNLSAISDKTPKIDVKPLQNGVKSIISELEASPASPERASLPFIKRVETTINKGEQLPISDVVELQKFLNSRYSPKKAGSMEKLAEAELGSKVRGILDDYGKQNPQWNDVYKQAQGFYQNQIAPLKDDFVKKIGFDVNDASVIDRFKRGELSSLPDELVSRARSIPSKVSDDISYKRLAPLVSPDKQKQFGKMVEKEAQARGAKSSNRLYGLMRTGAYGVGSIGGSPYMKGRFAAEAAGLVRGQDPLYPLIKRGVAPISETIAPAANRAQALAEQISKTPPAGQKLLPDYTKSGGKAPYEQMQAYVDELAAKRASELAPSNIGQERAAFEAAQTKAAQIAQMEQQLAAQPALEARQAGVDPQTYAKFLQQQTPPIVPQASVAPQPNVYYNPQEMAIKALNEARGAGKELVNPAFTSEEIINELMKLRLVGKRK